MQQSAGGAFQPSFVLVTPEPRIWWCLLPRTRSGQLPGRVVLSAHTVTQLPVTHVAGFGPVPVGRSGVGPMLPLLFLCPPSRVITVLGCCHREMPLLGCGPVVSGVKGTCGCECRQIWPKSPDRTHGEQMVLMPPQSLSMAPSCQGLLVHNPPGSFHHCTDERVGGSGCYNDLHVSQACKDPQAGHTGSTLSLLASATE